MNLDVWLRALLDEEADAPRLVPREVLIDDSPARQYQRILFVGHFGGRVVIYGVEFGSPVRMVEAFLEESRRARVIFRGAGPEDAVLSLYLLVSDAVVVTVSAARGDPQLVENLARRVELKIPATPHAACNLIDDPPV